jgi:hypothetical protein
VRLRSSINYYEELAANQAEQLSKLNKPRDFGGLDDEEGDGGEAEEPEFYTKQDLDVEEQEIRDLERKKRTLEERVAGIEKDLNF